MAGRIEGITVQIGGDTSPLSKALQGVNKEISGTQAQLKDVERLLKLDPGNTELLRQKQRLLGEAIGETKTKLEALKTAEQQAQAQFQKGEISQKQFDGLKREIISTEEKLKGLEKSYADLGNTASRALQGASEGLKSFGDKTAELGQKFLPVTGAIVGLGAAALHTADDFKGAMNDFTTQTSHAFKMVGESADGFDQVLKNIYAGNYGEGYDDIAQSMATVAKNAKDLSPESIEKMTTSAIVLRDTFEYDVQETMRAANMMMDQFGLTGEQAFNLIAQGSQSGLDKNGDFLDSINEYSVHFSQLGMNAEEMFNVFLAGAESGTFSIDKVGDAMKEFGIRVKDGSKSTEGAFEGLGLDAAQMQAAFAKGGDAASEAYWEVWHSLNEIADPIERNTIGVALFGTTWEDLGDAAVTSMMGMSDVFNSSIDTLSQIDEIKYDTVGEAITGLGRTINANILLPLIQEIMPTINDFVARFSSGAKAISEKFSGLDSETKKIILTIATIVAGIGPALIIIGKMASGFGTIVGIVGKLTSGFGSVVGIVGKVVGLFGTGGGLAGALTALTGPVGIAVAAVAALIAIFAGLYATNEDFRNKVQEIWEQIKQTFSSVLEQIKAVIQGFIDVAQAIWKNYGDEILAVAMAAFNNVKTFVETCLNLIRDAINIVLAIISGDWEAAWEGIKTFFSDAMTGIQNMAQGTADFLNKLFTLVGSVLGSIWEVIKGAALAAWEGIKTGVSNAIGNVSNAIKNGLDSAVQFISSLPAKFKTWGRDMVDGLISGITSKIDSVGTAVKNVANKVKSYLHFSRPDVGPLRDYETWMPDFMSGLANGIQKNMGLVTGIVDKLSQNMTLKMQPAVAGFGTDLRTPTSVKNDTTIEVKIERLDNGSGQAPREIAQKIDKELQDIAKRRGDPWR